MTRGGSYYQDSNATGGVVNMIIGVTFPPIESLTKRGLLERLVKGGMQKSVMTEGIGMSTMILCRGVMTRTKGNLTTTEERVM